MTCNIMKMPNGGTAIICARASKRYKCKNCGRQNDFLCDFELSGDMQGHTCDVRLCKRCRVHIDGKDYCMPHAKIIYQRIRGSND